MASLRRSQQAARAAIAADIGLGEDRPGGRMKRDYRKEWPQLYGTKREPVMIKVPSLNYLMVDGRGDPNGSAEYQYAVEALFSLSYTIKFAIKRETGADFAVMPLEGQWWCEDMRRFSVADKSNWLWTLMILQPPGVSA